VRLRVAGGARALARTGEPLDDGLACAPVVTPLDLADPAVVADPYPAFAAARAVAPVQWHDGLGSWMAFTHAESNAVLRDRRLGRVWAD
jgi:hypothetical protein